MFWVRWAWKGQLLRTLILQDSQPALLGGGPCFLGF